MNAPPATAEVSVVAPVLASRSPISPSWFVSILFWTSLLLAAILYGAVALSPKLAEWLRAREQYARNAVQLVRLEDEIVHLECVAQALRQDPEFARRVAGTPRVPDGDLVSAGRVAPENLPVAPESRFGSVVPNTTGPPQVDPPPFAGVVMQFARDNPLRHWLLTAAVLLILFGFTFLNDSENGYLQSVARAMSATVLFPVRRYWSVRTPSSVAADVPGMPQSRAESPPANSVVRRDSEST